LEDKNKLRKRGLLKFIVWGVIGVALVIYYVSTYTSGQMVEWYYYSTKTDGYAINSGTFDQATKEKPVALTIGKFEEIDGPKAVLVKKGERLPIGANGVIDTKTVKEGKRVKLDGQTLNVLMPIQIKESKGFKYKDRFKHKGVETNPWSGVWNLVMIVLLGFSLGTMAEGFTDMLGFKPHKSVHH